MINQVHGSTGPGLTIPCFIRRAADGFYYDWISATFVSSPATGHATANLTASAVNPSDYILSIASTPVAVWSDGKYTASAMYGSRSKTWTFEMVNGDDVQLALDIPFGFVVSAASDGTNVVLYGGNLPTTGVASGDYTGKILRMVGAGPFGYSTPASTLHTFAPSGSSGVTIGGVAVATHTWVFASTPGLARPSAVLVGAKVAIL